MKRTNAARILESDVSQQNGNQSEDSFCSFSSSSPNPYQFQVKNPYYTMIVCPNMKMANASSVETSRKSQRQPKKKSTVNGARRNQNDLEPGVEKDVPSTEVLRRSGEKKPGFPEKADDVNSTRNGRKNPKKTAGRRNDVPKGDGNPLKRNSKAMSKKYPKETEEVNDLERSDLKADTEKPISGRKRRSKRPKKLKNYNKTTSNENAHRTTVAPLSNVTASVTKKSLSTASTSATISTPSTTSPTTTTRSRTTRGGITTTTPEPITYLPPPSDTKKIGEPPAETIPEDNGCAPDLILINGVCLGFGALRGSGPRSMCQSHWQWSNTSCIPSIRATSAPLQSSKTKCADPQHRNVNGHCLSRGPLLYQPRCPSGWTSAENECMDEQVLGRHTRECQMDLLLVNGLCYGYEGPGDVWPAINCPSGFVLRNKTCLTSGYLPSSSACKQTQMYVDGHCFGIGGLMSSPRCISKWSYPSLKCLEPASLPIQVRPIPSDE